jgi:hypothetical protein
MHVPLSRRKTSTSSAGRSLSTSSTSALNSSTANDESLPVTSKEGDDDDDFVSKGQRERENAANDEVLSSLRRLSMKRERHTSWIKRETKKKNSNSSGNDDDDDNNNAQTMKILNNIEEERKKKKKTKNDSVSSQEKERQEEKEEQYQYNKLLDIDEQERKHIERAFENNASIVHVGFFALAMEVLMSGCEKFVYKENEIIAKQKDIEESVVVLVKGTAKWVNEEKVILNNTNQVRRSEEFFREGSTWAEGAILEPQIQVGQLIASGGKSGGATVIKIHKKHFEKTIRTVTKFSKLAAFRAFLSCTETINKFEKNSERMKFCSKYALKKYKRTFKKGEEIFGSISTATKYYESKLYNINNDYDLSKNQVVIHFLIDGSVQVKETNAIIENGSWFETSSASNDDDENDDKKRLRQVFSCASDHAVIISLNSLQMDICNDAYFARVEKFRARYDNSKNSLDSRHSRHRRQSSIEDLNDDYDNSSTGSTPSQSHSFDDSLMNVVEARRREIFADKSLPPTHSRTPSTVSESSEVSSTSSTGHSTPNRYPKTGNSAARSFIPSLSGKEGIGNTEKVLENRYLECIDNMKKSLSRKEGFGNEEKTLGKLQQQTNNNSENNEAPTGRTIDSLLSIGADLNQNESKELYDKVELTVNGQIEKLTSTRLASSFSRMMSQMRQRLSGVNISTTASPSSRRSTGFISTKLKSSIFSKTPKNVNPTHKILSKAKGIDEFFLKDLVGEGMLGFVFSATHKESGRKCAIKVMPKKKIIAVSEESHVAEEKECLISMQGAPFIAQFYSSFQDSQAVYLSIELCCGDMFELFNAIGLPSIGQTKVYAAQILLGLDSIHEKGYIYRDIKQENVLIRENGSIAICDFGFAKKLNGNERAFTICGTPDYLSPEVLLHQGASYASDIWAFGVLVFEMIAGYPPFCANDRQVMYDLIVNANFDQVPKPHNLDAKAEMLLKEIFVKDEDERLGGADIDEIMYHPWFDNLDWKAILDGSLRPLHTFPEGFSLARELDGSIFGLMSGGGGDSSENDESNESKNKFAGF